MEYLSTLVRHFEWYLIIFMLVNKLKVIYDIERFGVKTRIPLYPGENWWRWNWIRILIFILCSSTSSVNMMRWLKHVFLRFFHQIFKVSSCFNFCNFSFGWQRCFSCFKYKKIKNRWQIFLTWVIFLIWASREDWNTYIFYMQCWGLNFRLHFRITS